MMSREFFAVHFLHTLKYLKRVLLANTAYFLRGKWPLNTPRAERSEAGAKAHEMTPEKMRGSLSVRKRFLSLEREDD